VDPFPRAMFHSHVTDPPGSSLCYAQNRLAPTAYIVALSHSERAHLPTYPFQAFAQVQVKCVDTQLRAGVGRA